MKRIVRITLVLFFIVLIIGASAQEVDADRENKGILGGFKNLGDALKGLFKGLFNMFLILLQIPIKIMDIFITVPEKATSPIHKNCSEMEGICLDFEEDENYTEYKMISGNCQGMERCFVKIGE